MRCSSTCGAAIMSASCCSVLVVNGDNKAEYREVKLGRLVEGLRVVEVPITLRRRASGTTKKPTSAARRGSEMRSRICPTPQKAA